MHVFERVIAACVEFAMTVWQGALLLVCRVVREIKCVCFVCQMSAKIVVLFNTLDICIVIR